MEPITKNEKKPYEAPRITILGDIEAITLGSSSGNYTDAAFPINTPFRDLTFS
jgi:hypothetical protein